MSLDFSLRSGDPARLGTPLLAVALAPVSSGFVSTELRLPAALPAPVPAPVAENSPEAPMRNARWNTVPPRWFLAFCFFWVNISFFA